MSWFQWLGSSNGRLFLQGAAITSAVSVFAGMHLPQTVFLDKYQEVIQSYEKGIEQPLPDNVKSLFNQTIEDLKLSELEKTLVKPFTVYGFDVVHAGSVSVWTGSIIGIPTNFSYESEKDVNRKITVGTSKINWGSPEGQQLKNSLVLSENARKFGLAREITAVRNSSIWLYSSYPTLAVIGTYMFSRTLNDRLKLRQHPIRFIMYSLIASYAYAMYITFTDVTTGNIESTCDEEAAGISPTYAEGGIEFYKKLLERNKALRVLMGADGEKLYTTTGNEIAFLRIKTTPLVDRLRAVEEIAKNSVSEEK